MPTEHGIRADQLAHIPTEELEHVLTEMGEQPIDRALWNRLQAEVVMRWAASDNGGLPPEFTYKQHPATQVASWSPASEAQRMALECEADILLYGGAAGSLKSETLMVDASLEVDDPDLNAIIFRQSFPELRDLIKKSLRLYPRLGGTFVKGSPMCWTFPSGAKIWLGYLASDDNLEDHQGQEYSFVGFDEAGHQNEQRVRYMLTRLRTTSPNLKLRMRLTANPGGQGHAFLYKFFLRGVCPHCDPARAVTAGKLYTDAAFPSDGQPVSRKVDGVFVVKTVAFIPGKVTDHGLLGIEYVANLQMQSAVTSQQLLDGCWRQWEGQFFHCFTTSQNRVTVDVNGEPVDLRMVVPPGTYRVEPWYAHVIGGDYGFSGSSTAAYLMVRLPASAHFPGGRLLILDEYVEKGRTAKDFARDILERWYLNENFQIPERARNIAMMPMSPDALRQDGGTRFKEGVDVPFSRMEQMNEVLGPYGLGFIRAYNDRAAGWMTMFQMLRDGELIVQSNCTKLIEGFETALRDPKKFDDILKVPGLDIDDALDAARYAVMTWRVQGERPRQEIIQEAVRGLDPTSVAIAHARFEEQDRSRPQLQFRQKRWLTGSRM